ncbi:MAG: hypothetical protein ABI772_02380 [Bacteroidota bacterium]
MKNFKILLFIPLFITFHQQVKSQGCSDAGFCTMGALQPQQLSDTLYKNIFKLALSYGQGEQGTTIIQTIPECEFSFFKNNSIQLKIPFLFIDGNLGSNNGVGDISFSITQALLKTKYWKLNFTAGTKIATGKSDAEINNLPLPMPYQTSLGTHDIILGTSVQYLKWNLGLGFQKVLSNKNENNFLHSAYTNNADAQKYFESNFLDRGNDALLRIERSFQLNKLNLSAGLLAIYHLQENSLINDSGNRVAIKNSDGLTLNITGNAQYNFSNRTGLNLSFGFPEVVRKVRPDGLTRHFVCAVAFNYNFGK